MWKITISTLIRMKKFLLLATVATVIAGGCKKPGPEPEPDPEPPVPELLPIRLSTNIGTKATDSGFENGDKVGIYTVNYYGNTAGTLSDSGNHLDNIGFTLNGDEWKADKEVYWLDQTTPADFYCYFPYTASIDDVTALKFSVKEDQSTLANYKASELLWGKTVGAEPSADPVKITVNHAMSNIIIYLTPGNGYTEESLAAEEPSVEITGVKTDISMDLSTGSVTAEGDSKNITPYKENTYWRALVAPQDIIGTQLIKVTIGSDTYTLNQTVTFESNKQYKCTLKVNRISEGVNIGIGGWETDDKDFGGTLE